MRQYDAEIKEITKNIEEIEQEIKNKESSPLCGNKVKQVYLQIDRLQLCMEDILVKCHDN